MPRTKASEERHSIFIAEYLTNGFNATLAYKAAYKPTGNENTISTCATQLLRNPNVQKKIKTEINAQLGQYRNTLEKQLVDVYMKRAFFDITDYLTEDNEIDIDRLKEDGFGQLLDGVETKYYGKDADVKSIVFKSADRDKALAMLAKYMDLMSDKTVIEGNPDKPITITRVPATTITVQDKDADSDEG